MLLVVLSVILPRSAEAYIDVLDCTTHPIYTPPANYGSFGPDSPGFPGLGQTYTDTTFNTTIRRLSKNGVPGAWQPSHDDIYSKNGFWNSNGTLVLHRNPATGWTFVNTTTGDVVGYPLPPASVALEEGSFSPDPLKPHTWYYFDDYDLKAFDVLNGGPPTIVHTFVAPLAKLGGSVDWIDRTGRYMVVKTGSVIKVFDSQAENPAYKIFQGDIPGDFGGGWVGISPDAEWVVIPGGAAGEPNHAYKINHHPDPAQRSVSTNPVMFWSLGGDHGDLVSATDGKTYMVTFESYDKGEIYAVDVSQDLAGKTPAEQRAANRKLAGLTHVPKPNPPGGFHWYETAGHFSGVAKQGRWQDWVFISTNSGDDSVGGGPTNWRPYKSEVFMVNVRTGAKRRLTHHRSQSTGLDYRRSTRVSASWDGEQVAWASSFNVSSPAGYADKYATDLSTTPYPPPPNPEGCGDGGGGGDTTPPTVSMFNPVDGTTVSGTINVTATADDNVAVASVQFKLDGNDLGAPDTTEPYEVSWNTTTVSDGPHTLTAVATDTSGNPATSATVTVTVDNIPPDPTPPTVSITAPTDGATVSGTITVSANAQDNVAVAGVQFKLGDDNLGAQDTTSPYAITWNTTLVTNGTYTLKAVATDTSGNLGTSAPVTVTVSNSGPTPPTVSITAPTDGATVSGTITVSATAQDNVSVVGVQFKLNGVNLGAEDTTSPYGISWDTTTVSNGTHTLTAVARDNEGTTGTATVTVTVANGGGPTPENVVWTSAVNVTVTGNTITKSAGCSSCWDAGAISQQTITSGDGYVEFTTSAGAALTAGLGNGNTGTDANEIKWGLRFFTTYVEVRESGVWKADWSIVTGAVHRIAVEGGVVKYYQNGAVKYTSQQAPTYPLLLDATLVTTGEVLQNAIIARVGGGGGGGGPQNVVWTSEVNATVTGNTITKSAGCGGCWDAGGISQQTIASGDGYVEFTTSVAGGLTAGLSNGNTGTDGNEIKWGLRFFASHVEVRESGVYKTDWSIATGDVHRIAVEGGVVKYYQNGALRYTSTQAPTYPLLLDATLANVGEAVQNAVIAGAGGGGGGGPQNVVWTAPVNVTVNANAITKSAGCGGCWDAGAVSQQTIPSGDGYIEFTTSAGASLTAGLSTGNTGTDANEIKWGLRFFTGHVEVRESSVWKADWSIAAGDVHRVAAEGGVVKYYQNGALRYTSTVAPTYPLLLDATLAAVGETLQNAVISGAP